MQYIWGKIAFLQFGQGPKERQLAARRKSQSLDCVNNRTRSERIDQGDIKFLPNWLPLHISGPYSSFPLIFPSATNYDVHPQNTISPCTPGGDIELLSLALSYRYYFLIKVSNNELSLWAPKEGRMYVCEHWKKRRWAESEERKSETGICRHKCQRAEQSKWKRRKFDARSKQSIKLMRRCLGSKLPV